MTSLKKNIVFLVILLGFLIFAYSKRHINEKHSIAFFAMDTFFEITSNDKCVNEDLKKEVESLVAKIDKQINSYNPDSEIAQINRNAGKKETIVSVSTFHILSTAYHYSEISNGLFDVTFEPLQNLYGFENGVYQIPNEAEIKASRKKVDYRKMILNPKNQSVILAEQGMKINLSGLMKGYVLDEVHKLINQKGCTAFFLNFGGNLYIQNDTAEKIGIKHPRQENVIFSFPLTEGFVSTSADYQQFFEKNNHRYTHIINPITGSAIQKMQTMTVVGNSGILTDFLSTSLFLLDTRDIEKTVKTLNMDIEYFAYDGKNIFRSAWKKTNFPSGN
jgi:thiamine biosynthesis lipoprotein